MNPRSKRTYVLDTNVLLYDPSAIRAFEEHDVVIPMTVIEEVDRFKKQVDETGRNARSISRFLDTLRQQGSLREGVELNASGAILRVDYITHGPDLPITWGPENNDNRILRTVLRMHRDLQGKVTLITRDTNMRLKCDALGVSAEDYQNARIQVDEVYTGVLEYTVPTEVVDEVYANNKLELDPDLAQMVLPQQFVVLHAETNSRQTAMVRVDGRRQTAYLVGRYSQGVWGIHARNREQLFAFDLLLDDKIKLVTLTGVAGTGKTLLALACGLKLTGDEDRYRKLLVSRPIFPLGRDIGFLPGDVEQKLNPWMKPIFDNLELLVSTKSEAGRGKNDPSYQYLIDSKLLEVEPLTYIRGRSMPRQFLIVDEAQNLTPHEVKTIVSRVGEGTKIVLTGDVAQIDNPYLDTASNGLSYMVERLKGQPMVGHVTLAKSERSELASIAAEKL